MKVINYSGFSPDRLPIQMVSEVEGLILWSSALRHRYQAFMERAASIFRILVASAMNINVICKPEPFVTNMTASPHRKNITMSRIIYKSLGIGLSALLLTVKLGHSHYGRKVA